MLEGMLKDNENLGKQEDTDYAKYKCWCDNTKEEKAQAIQDGKDNIAELEATVRYLIIEVIEDTSYLRWQGQYWHNIGTILRNWRPW